MATLTSTTTKKAHQKNPFFPFTSILFLLFFVQHTAPLAAQSIGYLNAKGINEDSIELRITGVGGDLSDGLPESWFEFFWIHGNGNFTANTRDSFILAKYLNQGTSNPSYNAKAYSTSVYRSRGDVPTKMEGPVFPDPNNVPDGILRTKAVKSGYLHLQFNHHEIVPGDTTLWVLSIKNPLKFNEQNAFRGEVYLFFNSPVKIHKSPLDVVTTTSDNPDNVQPGRVVTRKVSQQLIEADSDTPRFSDFVFDTAFIFNANFWQQQYDIEGRINSFDPLRNAYKNGLLWHFEGLQGQEERHLFLEFKDAENIFDSGADSVTRVVDFLALITTDAAAEIVADSLDQDDLKIIESLQLADFISGVAGSNNSDGIIPDILNSDFSVSNRILDLFKVQPLAKRAHDPNQLTVQACSCPPQSDGAQKLIFTVEFENDGDAHALGARIAIALDSLIDATSIDEGPLAFFGPGLEADEISFSMSENNDSIVWTLKGMNVFSTKEVGSGSPLTYGQIVFTALTKPGTDLDKMADMNACIQFVDHVGLTSKVCTRSVKAYLLSQDQSKSIGAQDELQCQECVFPGCQFPIWLIVLIILVIGFALWIAFDNA